MTDRMADRYRFKTQFVIENSYIFELPRTMTTNQDLGGVQMHLKSMQERHPDLARYVVDTAQLIVEAAEGLELQDKPDEEASRYYFVFDKNVAAECILDGCWQLYDKSRGKMPIIIELRPKGFNDLTLPFATDWGLVLDEIEPVLLHQRYTLAMSKEEGNRLFELVKDELFDECCQDLVPGRMLDIGNDSPLCQLLDEVTAPDRWAGGMR